MSRNKFFLQRNCTQTWFFKHGQQQNSPLNYLTRKYIYWMHIELLTELLDSLIQNWANQNKLGKSQGSDPKHTPNPKLGEHCWSLSAPLHSTMVSSRSSAWAWPCFPCCTWNMNSAGPLPPTIKTIFTLALWITSSQFGVLSDIYQKTCWRTEYLAVSSFVEDSQNIEVKKMGTLQLCVKMRVYLILSSC